MKPKEIILLAGGALLLSNVSIIGGLYAGGYFNNPNELEIAEHEEVPIEETPPEEAATEEERVVELGPDGLPLPPKPRVIPSMPKAMYVCEDKLKDQIAGKGISYQVDSVATRADDEAGLYKVFFETYTSSRAGAPTEGKSIACEVSFETMEISGYKVLPL